MAALKLEKATALKIFGKSSKEIQQILIESFGKEMFSGKIIDRINTFEDAYENADDKTRQRYDDFLKSDSSNYPDRLAYEQLILIIKVVNEDWVPDFKNENQYKYYPWFKVLSSGFGFAYSHDYYVNAGTSVGSRLCFETQEKCEYIAKKFVTIYKSFLM